jgi:hypothetical protein
MELELSKAPEVGGDRKKLKAIIAEEIKHASNPDVVFPRIIKRAIQQEIGYSLDNLRRIMDDIDSILKGEEQMIFLNFAMEWFRKSRQELRKTLAEVMGKSLDTAEELEAIRVDSSLD